jgi:hypothetical protein
MESHGSEWLRKSRIASLSFYGMGRAKERREGQWMSDDDLRLRARQAIRSKRIPNRHPERIWGSPADGDICAICSSSVGGLALGLEFARGKRAARYSVHIDCFAAWKLESDLGTAS